MDERTKAIVSAAVIIAVNVAAFFGVTLDQNTVLDAALAVAALIATIWGIWRNHNFTDEAIQAQGVLDHLKAERLAAQARGE